MLSYFKRDKIKEWRKKVGEDEANKIAKAAANRGTAVHNLVEKFIGGEEVTTHSTNPFYFSLFKPIKYKLQEKLSETWVLEAPLYSDFLKLAGRTDLIGVYDNHPTIIDFKTATKEKKREWIEDYFIQASIYAIMFKERTGVTINTFAILIVDEDGTLKEYTGKCSDYFTNIKDLRKKYPF
jgi:hypothetical protein